MFPLFEKERQGRFFLKHVILSPQFLYKKGKYWAIMVVQKVLSAKSVQFLKANRSKYHNIKDGIYPDNCNDTNHFEYCSEIFLLCLSNIR